MYKSFLHIVFLTGIYLFGLPAQAQFINFRLEIPAGVNYTTSLLSPLVEVEHRPDGQQGKSPARVWIGMQAQENLSFLLEVREENGPRVETLFLNDGSSNFEQARILASGLQTLQMRIPAWLMRNLKPRPPYLLAWLGLPQRKDVQVIIEYP